MSEFASTDQEVSDYRSLRQTAKKYHGQLDRIVRAGLETGNIFEILDDEEDALQLQRLVEEFTNTHAELMPHYRSDWALAEALAFGRNLGKTLLIFSEPDYDVFRLPNLAGISCNMREEHVGVALFTSGHESAFSELVMLGTDGIVERMFFQVEHSEEDEAQMRAVACIAIGHVLAQTEHQAKHDFHLQQDVPIGGEE